MLPHLKTGETWCHQGGRGVGKTTLGLKMAAEASKRGQQVLYIYRSGSRDFYQSVLKQFEADAKNIRFSYSRDPNLSLEQERGKVYSLTVLDDDLTDPRDAFNVIQKSLNWGSFLHLAAPSLSARVSGFDYVSVSKPETRGGVFFSCAPDLDVQDFQVLEGPLGTVSRPRADHSKTTYEWLSKMLEDPGQYRSHDDPLRRQIGMLNTTSHTLYRINLSVLKSCRAEKGRINYKNFSKLITTPEGRMVLAGMLSLGVDLRTENALEGDEDVEGVAPVNGGLRGALLGGVKSALLGAVHRSLPLALPEGRDLKVAELVEGVLTSPKRVRKV